MKQKEDNQPIGIAKRDIKGGETIEFIVKGNRWYSKDIKLNKHGKEYFMENAVDKGFDLHSKR